MIIKNMKNPLRIFILLIINYIETSQRISENFIWIIEFSNKILFLRMIVNYF